MSAPFMAKKPPSRGPLLVLGVLLMLGLQGCVSRIVGDPAAEVQTIDGVDTPRPNADASSSEEIFLQELHWIVEHGSEQAGEDGKEKPQEETIDTGATDGSEDESSSDREKSDDTQKHDETENRKSGSEGSPAGGGEESAP